MSDAKTVTLELKWGNETSHHQPLYLGTLVIGSVYRPLDGPHVDEWHVCFGYGADGRYPDRASAQQALEDAVRAMGVQPRSAHDIPGVDGQVVLVATECASSFKKHPEWLWYSEDRTSFGRWAADGSQAPYIRADLLIGAASASSVIPDTSPDAADAGRKMDAEIDRILAMSDEEILAEALAEGRDIDAEAEEMRVIIAKASQRAKDQADAARFRWLQKQEWFRIGRNHRGNGAVVVDGLELAWPVPVSPELSDELNDEDPVAKWLDRAIDADIAREGGDVG